MSLESGVEMDDGLDALLLDHAPAEVNGLRAALREYLASQYPGGRLVRQDKIKPRVHRLHFDVDGNACVWIVKRLEGRIARRNELVARRWLPAVSLGQAAPPLLTTAGTADGESVWHVYADLGPWSLDAAMDARRLQAAVELLADIHARFTGHILLAEARLLGGDLGSYFVTSNTSDAILSLESAGHSMLNTPPVVTRLLEYLDRFRGELPERLAAVQSLAGPETLLHGDLWTSNIFVTPDGQARLIDWDHAAAGPPAYDLSTLVLRFPPGQRREILELYRRASAGGTWQIPSWSALNQVFETFEIARFASRIIWPAIALWENGAGWALDELAEIERWFLSWQPVFSEV